MKSKDNNLLEKKSKKLNFTNTIKVKEIAMTYISHELRSVTT